MPYLEQCLESVANQSRKSLELIVIDDGSTDGSGEFADSFAEEHPDWVTVVHQPNSGGPAEPRNRGLGLAKGRYVFFLDADDYLGTEAIEKLVQIADENDSDVVLVKMAGVDGRHVPGAMFKATAPNADLFASSIYWTLRPQKLFRRSLLSENEIRFETALATGEDQPFVARAFFCAKNISVLADHAHYFTRQRDDGQNVTSRVVDPKPRIDLAVTMINLVKNEFPVVAKRNHLLHRHISVELMRAIQAIVRDGGADHKLFEPLAQAIVGIDHPGVTDKTNAIVRLQYHLLLKKDFVRLERVAKYALARRESLAIKNREWISIIPDQIEVEDGRCFAGYPTHDDADLPSELFDITDEITKFPGMDEVEKLHRDVSIITNLESVEPTTITKASLVNEPTFGIELTGTSPNGFFAVQHERWSTQSAVNENGSAFVPLLGTGKWTIEISVPIKFTKRLIWRRSGSWWRASATSTGDSITVQAGKLNFRGALRRRLGLH